MDAVSFRSVSFAYPKSEYKALDSVSFGISKGDFCLVSGASAAGKSTLLSLIKKEIAPAGELGGEIEINGSVGYLRQNTDESIVCDRVRGELAFGVENLGKSSGEIELLIAETAAYFNLEDKLNSATAELSGGEKQLVSLASVMMMKPDILVLDEPCAYLDPVSAERFANMVKKLHSELGITVIMSEHSVDLLYGYADKILLLEKGSLTFEGTPEETLSFLEKENNPMLAAVPVQFRYKGKELNYNEMKENGENPEIALNAKRLYFAYNKNSFVLNDLSLDVYRGKINAVIGSNGCGKTTLLKVLSRVYKPYRGKVNSEKLSMLTQNVKDLFTADRCGDEVTFGEITDYLEISDIKERHPYDLSGGQAQRLALAKVLEKNADIIILDEPTKGLDAVLKTKLGKLLKRLCADGKTVLLVSHDIDFVGEWADYVSFMSEGRIAVTDEKRRFFSSLSFYTTSLSRLSRGRAVCSEDVCDE